MQFRCGVPAPNGHVLVSGCSQDLIQPALGAERAEALRVDHTIARPDSIDSLPWTEYRHCPSRLDTHQEDRIAVIHIGLLAKAFGPVVDNSAELIGSQHQGLDEFTVKSEALGQSFFNPSSDLIGALMGSENHIATGNVILNIRISHF